jgi:hypothetical protein
MCKYWRENRGQKSGGNKSAFLGKCCEKEKEEEEKEASIGNVKAVVVCGQGIWGQTFWVSKGSANKQHTYIGWEIIRVEGDGHQSQTNGAKTE